MAKRQLTDAEKMAKKFEAGINWKAVDQSFKEHPGLEWVPEAWKKNGAGKTKQDCDQIR